MKSCNNLDIRQLMQVDVLFMKKRQKHEHTNASQRMWSILGAPHSEHQ